MHKTVFDAITEKKLPSTFIKTIETVYQPIARAISMRCKSQDGALLVGVQGTQGSGKTTMASFLRLILQAEYQLNVAVVSIDDFYLTRCDRQQLAKDIHPLLVTRGVPGTHDLPLALSTLKRLQQLQAGETCSIPRFDKAVDDRAEQYNWPTVTGSVDVIIFEGWCVGMPPQREQDLLKAVNDLEAYEDIDCVWRRYVNNQLKTDYAKLFAMLHCLVVINAPSFECVYQWRQLQEKKLAESLHDASSRQKASSEKNIMLLNDQQLTRFIAHYQRLTQYGLEQLPACADWLIQLDNNHAVERYEERL